MAVETGSRGTDVEAVGERFGDVLRATRVDADEPTLVVEAAALRDVLAFLRDERGFQLLRSVTAVDFHPAEPRFQLVYHLTAMPPATVAGEAEPSSTAPTRLLRLKVALPGSEPVADSVVALYPTADYHEREVFDMFGIEFRGHPDLRRILMPETFEGHPLRKDYPLVYEEVAFSGNAERVHASKPRAER